MNVGAIRARQRCRMALAVAALAVVAAGCAPRRPATAPIAAPVEPVQEGNVLRLGASWLRRAGPGAGVLVGRFEGEPSELGYAVGRLTRHRIATQERFLDRLLVALIPNGLSRTLVQNLALFRIRGMDREIPDDFLAAIAGEAEGYEPVPPARGEPAYRRLVAMHALHDISQRFIDSDALQSLCTGFLAGPGATRDGHVLLARNFDWEGGSVFDREKIVCVFVPAGKIPYASVGFAGMLGVVSGLNREGIGVAVQAIAGGETATVGEPITIVLADLLRSESTFEGALERLRRAKVFVSDLVLLGDAKTGRLAVVEKTPSAFAVREVGAGGSWIGAANEAETEEVKRLGLQLPEGSTSRRRELRLVQLLTEHAGGLDPVSAAAILRDRRNAAGTELGPGNRNAIDALVTAHSVVLDLTARRVYAAAAPHALGAYVPVDLDAVLRDRDGRARLSEARPVHEDELVTSGGYDRYVMARSRLRRARRELARGETSGAIALLSSAHALSPAFAEAEAALGEALARGGRREEALRHLEGALARDPGPPAVRAAIEALVNAVRANAPLPKELLPLSATPDEMVEESAARDMPLAW